MYFYSEIMLSRRKKEEYCFLKIEVLQIYYFCPRLTFSPQHKIYPIYNQYSKPIFQT